MNKSYLITGFYELSIKKFVLGAGEVKFENNKATITKMKYDSSLEYSYELSDENAKLVLYLNEEETTELNSLKENDIIKLLVLDENNNENVYEILVKDSSAALSLFVYGLAILIMIFPILVIILVIVFIKKKKRRHLYK